VMLQAYPVFDKARIDTEAEEGIEWLKGIITAIRNIRGEMDISPAKSIDVFLRGTEDRDKSRLQSYKPYLQKLAKLKNIEWLAADQQAPIAATQLHGGLEILVPMAGLIDVEAERARLQKEIAKLEAGLQAVEGKLGKQKFVDNAPAAVVDKERSKQTEMSAALAALQEKLGQLDQL